MKVKRTPRELVKEIEGAKFYFDRADLRELGLYWSHRPDALRQYFEQVAKDKEEGREVDPEYYQTTMVKIFTDHPEWYEYRSKFILGKLKRVEGLTYEDGEPVPPGEFVYDVPTDVITSLMNWYESEMFDALPSRVTEEKKQHRILVLKLLRSTLYRPNLNCLTCFKTYDEGLMQGEEILPLCETEQGCDIRDCAPQARLVYIVRMYINAKASRSAQEVPAVQEKILRRVGLINDVDLLLEMDAIYSEWLRYEMERRAEMERARGGSRGGHING